MLQYKNRVSYSQLDREGKIGISQVVDVMQDACMFHCEEVGRSCMALKEEQRAWLVSAWHIQFHDLPKMAEEYVVSTWPYKMRGVFNYQNVILESTEGGVYACGDSSWFFYDQANNKPVRIPEKEMAYYELEPSFDMEHVSRKLVLPQNLKLTQEIPVSPNYLDTNDHVNNGQYVRLAVNVLPDGFSVGELRAEFRNAAHGGDILYVRTADIGDVFSVVLTDEAGTPYFLGEFKKKAQ